MRSRSYLPHRWAPARRRAALAVAVVAAVGLLAAACTGSSSSTSTSKSTLVWYVPEPVNNSGDSAVFVAANKIIERELKVNVKFIPVSGADYATKMTTILAAHEPVDILFAANWSLPYTSNALAGAFYPLDDLIKKYGKDYQAVASKSVVDAAAVDGKIYGLTGLQNIMLQPTYTIETRFVQAAGYPISGGHVVIPGSDKYKQNNIEPLLAKIKASPAAKQNNFTTLFQYSSFFDPMAWGYWPIDSSIHGPHPFYVKMGTTKVTMALPTIQNYVNLMRSWYQKGYQPHDAGTAQGVTYLPATSAVGFNFTGGNFRGSGGIGVPAAQQTVDVPLSPRPFYMGYNGGESIAATSKHPKEAMQLLNLLYTNADLMNLFTYGIKGVDYTVQNGVAQINQKGGYVSDGCWQFGNCYLTYPYPPYGKDFWKRVQKWNAQSFVAPLSGFAFNSHSVSAQWDQLATVTARYEQPLFTGSVSEQKQFPKYVAALKAAGSDTVVKEIQAQLDAYLKTHPQVKTMLLGDTYQKVMSGHQASGMP